MKDIYEKRVWLKNYPDNYPAELAMPDLSALDIFESSAFKYPDSPAIHYFEETITYGELNSLANHMALGLADMGVRKEDRVIIQLQNIPQFLICLYAVWKLGGIVVGLNPMYKERELEYYCNDSQAQVIISLESCYREIMNLPKKTNLKTIITTSELDFIPIGKPLPKLLKTSEKKKLSEAIDLMDILNKYKGGQPPKVFLKPQDIAYLTYTSGTTGFPKGAMNTHGNIVFNANNFQVVCNLDRKDTVVSVAPFFHVTGSIANLAVASLMGIPVIAFFRFEPGEVLRLIEKWKGSMIAASLTVFIALLEHPDLKRRDIRSLTKVISGGAPVPQSFVDRFEKYCNVYIHNWYGLTETTSACTVTPIGVRSPVDPLTKALSVGVPIANSVLKIIDAESGVMLPPGEIGEILVKAPTVIPGYWNNPGETQKAIRDGWLYTGDVGKMDENGWFYIVDRKKDLINVSGYKVWPRDVEDILYEHRAVSEACVIGVPDAYRGETVKAFIILRENYRGKITEKEIIEFAQGKMAAYKYPRIVEFVTELPKTVSGKLLKRELRDGEATRMKKEKE